jgi:hypothetical protein
MTQRTDASEVLLRGIRSALDIWASRAGNTVEPLYWVLRLQLAETGLDPGASVGDVASRVPSEQRESVVRTFKAAQTYFDDIRYVSLEPVTQVWGTVVNALRAAAGSNRTTPVQRQVFQFSPESLVRLFVALRSDKTIADDLYHAYKAMPATECQALAALLNVENGVDNVGDVGLDADTMMRLIRLLDHEGPMSAEEQSDLASLSRTQLVSAAFSGLRSRG